MSCCQAPPSVAGRAAAAGDPDAAPVVPGGQVALWRLVSGGVLAGNTMTASLAVNLADEAPTTRFALHLGLLAATTVVVGLLAAPLVAQLRALWRARTLGVEALFAVAAAGASAYSLHSTFVSGGDVYYEVVGLLLTIYALSQRLKGTMQLRVEALLTRALLLDAAATCLRGDGTPYAVDVKDVRRGDLVQVHPGEVIPVDGTVELGEGTVQTLSLSGEPFGRTVRRGGAVLATWVALDATLLVRATRDGGAREVDHIGARVRRGMARREALEGARPTPATQLLVARLVRWFAPAVVLAAAGTVLFWLPRVAPPQALLYGLSVLLVACPCALGFAVPLGLRLGVMRLARQGVAVKTLEAIERLATVDGVVFDKTGTLTQVAVGPEDVHMLPPAVEGVGQGGDGPPTATSLLNAAQLFALAQQAQRAIDHPIAAAFSGAPQRTATPWSVETVRVLAGNGIEAHGRDASDCRRTLALGDAAHLVPADQADAVAALVASLPREARCIAACIDGRAVAVVALHERATTPLGPLFAQLQAFGLPAQVMSGDTQARVTALGVGDAQGARTAAQKAQALDADRQLGRRICFVGDGFNDAAAMAEAAVGVALADGSALTREVADVILPARQPQRLLEAIRGCREIYATLRRNVTLAVAYNVVGMMVAACGWLTPVAAALLMLASSLTVSGHTLWVHREGSFSPLARRATA